MQKKKLWIIIGSIVAIIIVLAISLPIILLSNQNKEINWDEVVFESRTVLYDGEFHYLEVKGEFPSSMEITYDNNGHKEVGTYIVTAHFKDKDKTYPDMFATLTIVRDGLEHITFSDQTYTYDGQEKSIYIVGDLAEGIEVTYTNNNQIHAGVYEVTATFCSVADNEIIGVLKAKLTILKAVLSLDTLIFRDQTIPYDGTEKSLTVENLPEGIEVIYMNNHHTSVGVYEVTATFQDLTGNYQIEGTLKAVLTIIKGTYDMSSVFFDSVEIPYDGVEHTLLITGQLPLGVEVLQYIDNKRTEVGTSYASVEFKWDEKNYNPIPKMEATLTIVKGKMTFLKETEFITIYNGAYQGISYPNLPEGIIIQNWM